MPPHPVTRARILAAFTVPAGAGLMAYGAWGAGLAVLSLGAAALLLVTERVVDPRVPDAAAAGPGAALGALARALNVDGHGIVIPGGGAGDASRVFVPAKGADVNEVRGLDTGTVLHRDGPVGVLLPAPGAALEAAWRDAHGLPEGRGAEEAAQHVRAALPQLGLGEDVVTGVSGDRVRVAYVSTALADACRASRETAAPWHVQGACPACSFVTILVARAHAGPVRIVDAGTDGARVFIDVEVGARSPA